MLILAETHLRRWQIASLKVSLFWAGKGQRARPLQRPTANFRLSSKATTSPLPIFERY
jgi:hypothetical protein